MTGFEGMNVGEVRNVARELYGQASRLDSVALTVDRLVGVAFHHWDGVEAVDFQQWWIGQYRPRLVAAANDLRSAGSALLQQSSDQFHISGGTAASAGTTKLAGPGERASLAGILSFAEAAYGSPTQLPAGWSEVDDDALRKLGLDQSDLHDRSTGLDARVFCDGQGHYVLAFAGSEGDKSLLHPSTDWGQDYQTVASAGLPLDISHQAQAAADLAVKIHNSVGDGNLQLTGHSLGGRDAAVASVATGATAVTFNAAGPTDEDLLYARELSGHHTSLGGYVLGRLSQGESLRQSVSTSQITNFETSGDPVSALQRAGQYLPIHLSREPLGTSVVVADGDHALSNFEGKF